MVISHIWIFVGEASKFPSGVFHDYDTANTWTTAGMEHFHFEDGC